jgi:DMATS type aromatic prenyltransferase
MTADDALTPPGAPAPSETLHEYGARQLRALCAVAGFEADEARILALFRDLSASWGAVPLAAPPRWSGITDDCSPLEFSVVYGGSQPELRFLVEPHGEPASPAAYWSAGQQLTAWLRERFALSTEPLECVEELFVPIEGDVPVYFAVYHAVVFRPGQPPLFKIYLNPGARGMPDREVCAEALQRLGLGAAWTAIAAVLTPYDQLVFFSLDLSPQLGARAKVYVRHRGATVADLERTASAAAEYQVGDARALCQAIVGEPEPDLYRPPLTTLYCAPDQPERPQRAALQLPLYPYAPDDAVAYERIRGCLVEHGLDPERYERCVRALAPGSLAEESGLHGWVSLQREHGRPRITTYFHPRVYRARYGPLALDPARCWPSPAPE